MNLKMQLSQNTDENNRLIQKILRELDYDTVLNLCRDDEFKELIQRNLAPSVSEKIDADIKTEEKPSKYKIDTAIFLFTQKHYKITKVSKLVPAISEDEVHFETKENIVEAIIRMRMLLKQNDFSELASIVESIPDENLKKIFETVLFGYDPIRGEQLIDSYINNMRAEADRKYNILKNGILSVLSGDTTEELIMKLNV